MRLALDNHYSPKIALGLRERGHDCVAALEMEWNALSDSELIERCNIEHRPLLTNDVGDHTRIAVQWRYDERSHPGLIFTSDSSWPRTRDTIGLFINALDELMTANPNDKALVGRIIWL